MKPAHTRVMKIVKVGNHRILNFSLIWYAASTQMPNAEEITTTIAHLNKFICLSFIGGGLLNGF